MFMRMMMGVTSGSSLFIAAYLFGVTVYFKHSESCNIVFLFVNNENNNFIKLKEIKK